MGQGSGSDVATCVCVVLAAGRAMRMARKLLLPFGAGTVLDTVLAACADMPTVLVAAPEIAELLPLVIPSGGAKRRSRGTAIECSARDKREVVVNREPERGMVHSLRLAHEAIPEEQSIAILLGDKPLVTRGLIERIVRERDPNVDVAFPIRDGVPGHPVVLGPRARALLAQLPDGDTLHLLRDDARLVRRAIPVDDEGAYLDVDTEEDYRKALAIVSVS